MTAYSTYNHIPPYYTRRTLRLEPKVEEMSRGDIVWNARNIWLMRDPPGAKTQIREFCACESITKSAGRLTSKEAAAPPAPAAVAVIDYAVD